MGNNSQKPKRKINKIQFDLACSKTFYHIKINRDRRINELQKKEAKLKEQITQPNVNSQAVIHEAVNCITVLNLVQGCNITMRNVNLLKENSMALTKSINERTPLLQLEPLVHSVVWSTGRLNLGAVKEFSDIIAYYVDNKIYEHVEVSPHVDLELKKKFNKVIPDPLQINKYLQGFVKRNGLDSSVLSKVYPGGGGNRGGYNQGGYNQGGNNQGGYNQGGNSQGGYNQGQSGMNSQNNQGQSGMNSQNNQNALGNDFMNQLDALKLDSDKPSGGTSGMGGNSGMGGMGGNNNNPGMGGMGMGGNSGMGGNNNNPGMGGMGMGGNSGMGGNNNNPGMGGMGMGGNSGMGGNNSGMGGMGMGGNSGMGGMGMGGNSGMGGMGGNPGMGGMGMGGNPGMGGMGMGGNPGMGGMGMGGNPGMGGMGMGGNPGMGGGMNPFGGNSSSLISFDQRIAEMRRAGA